MFAPAAVHRTASNAFAGTYRQIGIETGVAAASPHQLVSMLFDGFNDAITQARAALQQGQIETKGRAIGRAARIVDEGLKGSLDLNAGGKLAQDLLALYAYVGRRLTHANLNNDADALDECVRLMEPLRSAWGAIRPAVSASASGQ